LRHRGLPAFGIFEIARAFLPPIYVGGAWTSRAQFPIKKDSLSLSDGFREFLQYRDC
jgi:hypothetical protein